MGTENSPTPPSGLHNRKAGLSMNALNTLEVPCDPQDPNFSRWFDSSIGPHQSSVTRPMRTGNQVTSFIGGAATYAAMGAAMATATGPGHYIYMLNWWVDLTVTLGSSTLSDIITKACAAGVQVRALFWDQPGTQNNAEAYFICSSSAQKTPGDGYAIVDNNTLYVGSHHQKILVVNGSSGLIAFCGGVDFNPDRISYLPLEPGSPLHDVHCRIVGPAAWDLLQIFVDRWNDHPTSANVSALRATSNDPLPAANGDQYVQIGRTFPNGSKFAGISSRNGKSYYSFAQYGEQTCEAIIFKAIAQAQQFIYVQDQYLQSMDASNALKAALPNIKKLIILIPHPSLSDHPNIWRFEKAFLDNLGYDPTFKYDPNNPNDPKAKIAVCYLKGAGLAPNPKLVPPATQGTYVHSKMWIIDDKFAVIGSANCNNRGYTNDSEVVAGIYDQSKNTPCTLHFAHDLRNQLWSLHLGLSLNDVFDPIGAAAHWLAPTVASGVGRFNQNADTDSSWAPRNQIADNTSEPIGN